MLQNRNSSTPNVMLWEGGRGRGERIKAVTNRAYLKAATNFNKLDLRANRISKSDVKNTLIFMVKQTIVIMKIKAFDI